VLHSNIQRSAWDCRDKCRTDRAGAPFSFAYPVMKAAFVGGSFNPRGSVAHHRSLPQGIDNLRAQPIGGIMGDADQILGHCLALLSKK
jgi:hypothetical protein